MAISGLPPRPTPGPPSPTSASGAGISSWLAAKDESHEAVRARCLAWQRKRSHRNPKPRRRISGAGTNHLSRFGRTRDLTTRSAAAEAAYAASCRLVSKSCRVPVGAGGCAVEGGGNGRWCRLGRSSRALELDAINVRAGHTDKRLPPARRELMKKILGEGESTGAVSNTSKSR